MPTDEENERLSHADAAARLGVSTRTLANYRERGLIKADEEPEGLNTRYWYTPHAIQACTQRLKELREQR